MEKTVMTVKELIELLSKQEDDEYIIHVEFAEEDEEDAEEAL
ncbi:hypothetical protein [Anaerobium acetethylicum]|uniref:Uncharacterized protein n=1 Tax=Anaerobium acetethylicum TaxID=1619234 RepID=A0A1D3TUI2_9FIRM|nr:hypothetical protein [Anaerobium acetethylicum]SCP97743.1 hypothetical protein SAMN05421730_101348 [Anaerobium acetethylicum]